jgi:hypothetical protein
LVLGKIRAVFGAQLRRALQDWKKAKAIAGHIGEAVCDDRGVPKPREFVQKYQHGHVVVAGGRKIARVEIDQLLQQEAVERRHPRQVVRGDAEV